MRQNLGDVVHLEVILRADALDAVFEHGDAEGAGGGQRVRAGRERLFDARVVDALADLLLHPDSAAAAATAERAVAVARHLGHAVVVDDVEHLARGVVDAVPAANEAGVVVGELAAVEAGGQGELAGLDQAVDELGVVDNLVVAAELGVLVLDGVEAVRAGGDDGLDVVGAAGLDADASARGGNGLGGVGGGERLVDVACVVAVAVGLRFGALVEAVAVQDLDVLRGEHVPEILIADAARGVAGAAL